MIRTILTFVRLTDHCLHVVNCQHVLLHVGQEHESAVFQYDTKQLNCRSRADFDEKNRRNIGIEEITR